MYEIQETYNGGAVKKIEILQPDNKWYPAWENKHLRRRQVRFNLRIQYYKDVSNP